MALIEGFTRQRFAYSHDERKTNVISWAYIAIEKTAILLPFHLDFHSLVPSFVRLLLFSHF